MKSLWIVCKLKVLIWRKLNLSWSIAKMVLKWKRRRRKKRKRGKGSEIHLLKCRNLKDLIWSFLSKLEPSTEISKVKLKSFQRKKSNKWRRSLWWTNLQNGRKVWKTTRNNKTLRKKKELISGTILWEDGLSLRRRTLWNVHIKVMQIDSISSQDFGGMESFEEMASKTNFFKNKIWRRWSRAKSKGST